MDFSLEGKRVYVAGHNGMVGKALMRRLATENCEVVTVERNKVDLKNQYAVDEWMKEYKPDVVLLAAATVGGIHANRSEPAKFLYDNLMIATNIIHSAKANGVKKLLFLGSSCIYPKNAVQPIKEDALLTGALEPTNQWYAVAKIAGLKLVQAYNRQYGCNFISCMPTNLYGPFDNYNLLSSHVIPALLRKIYEAKKANKQNVILWGTGTARREFLYVDDLADACVFLIKNYSQDETINIGVGKDITIHDLARLIAVTIGYGGDFLYDTAMPDGPPQKLLNISKLEQLGWQAKTTLKIGIEQAYKFYISHHNKL